jgi:small ligand-binding sensory domain FIST
MMKHLVEKIGDKEVVSVFHTDCAARGRALFNKILKDEIIHKMQFPVTKDKQIPWLGMYGYGEFTLLGGKNRFHNYTTSLYVLVRK